MEQVIVLGALAGLLLGGIALVVRRFDRQRSADLRRAADRLGWSYVETVPFESVPDLDRFELFQPGRDRKLRNLLASPPDQPRAVVFEYEYTTGSGKSRKTHRQTVFYGTGPHLDLPGFTLRPETFFHRVGELFGYQDIDLEKRPVFSRMFLLRGAHQAAVRAVFTDAVAEFFERRPRMCAAGARHELLYWQPGRRR
jgi:hypothetical protein